jgi:predicted phosphodiesterase
VANSAPKQGSTQPLSPCAILHISDIHRAPDCPSSNFALFKGLQLDIDQGYDKTNQQIPDPRAHLRRPEIIILSGDLVQKGTAAEYKHGKTFLDALATVVGKDRIILIPGNHDVDWGQSQKAFQPSTVKEFRNDQQDIRSRQPFRQYVKKDPKKRGVYWKKSAPSAYARRLRAFKQFFDEFYEGRHSYSLSPASGYTIYDFAASFNLVVVGFNSAYEVDHLDSRAYLDTDAVHAAASRVNEIAPEAIKIAVFHHNLRSVEHGEDFIDPKHVTTLHDYGFVLCLHGHVHQPSEDAILDTHILPVIGAGSLAAPSRDRPGGVPRSYNVFIVHPTQREAFMHVRGFGEDDSRWKVRALEDGHLYKRLSLRPRPPSSTGGAWADRAPDALEAISQSIAEATSTLPQQREALEVLIGSYEETLGRRFCESVDIRSRQQVETHGEYSLVRHDLHYKLVFAAGDEELVKIRVLGEERVADLARREAIGVRACQPVFFRVDGEPVDPANEGDVELDYAVRVGPAGVVVEYEYTLYHLSTGLYMITLRRFARHLHVMWQEAPELSYEFGSMGGLPDLELKPSGPFDFREGEIRELCLPHQGYFVMWYKSEEGRKHRSPARGAGKA